MDLYIYQLRRTDDALDYGDPEQAVVIARSSEHAREVLAAAVWFLPTTKATLLGRAVPGLPPQVLLFDRVPG